MTVPESSARRANGGGNIKQIGPSRWRVRVTVGYTPSGAQKRIERVYPTEADAKRGVIKLQAEAEVAKITGQPVGSSRGRRKAVADPANAPMTVQVWIEEHFLPARTARRLSPSSASTYRSALKRAIEHLGDRPLDTLVPKDLARLAAITEAETSDVNALNVVRYTVTALRAAGAAGHPVPNWLAFWKPGEQVEVRPRVKGTLDATQLKAVLGAEPDPQERLRILVGCLTGLRQGAVLGLRWSELDLKEARLQAFWQLQAIPYDGRRHLNRFAIPDGFEAIQVVGGLHLTRPKWLRNRPERELPVLPLPQLLVDALRDWKDAWTPNDWDLVFSDPDGRPRRVTTDNANWKAAQVRAGITSPVTVHGMRRSAATILADLGIPREVIQSILGHADVETTSIYARESEKQARAAIDALGAALGGRNLDPA